MQKKLIKINLKSEELLEAASKLKVLGHPIRISIIQLLEKQVRMNVTEIFKALRIKQAIASIHLNNMQNNNLLVSDKEGKNTYYSVAQDEITQAVNLILNLKK